MTECEHPVIQRLENPFGGCVTYELCVPESHGGKVVGEWCVSCGAGYIQNRHNGQTETVYDNLFETDPLVGICG